MILRSLPKPMNMTASPEIALLDVGHGNAAVIYHPQGVIIVDAGHGDTVLEYLSLRDVGAIKTVLLSHADSDHIGGLTALLAEPRIKVEKLYVNPDATKETATWQDLRVAVKDARQRAALDVHTELTTSTSVTLEDPHLAIEVLAPTPEVAMGGVGGSDLDDRRLRTNTMSAVVRVSDARGPLLLLPGDLDGTGLANLLDSGANLKTKILVFPHHGGSPRSTNAEEFAGQLIELAEPDTVVFSIGRGLHDTPRPDIVRTILKQRPGIHVACTELSEHCAAMIPKDAPKHLSGLPARALAAGACCAGTLAIKFEDAVYLPLVGDHQAFVTNAAPSALCMDKA